MLPTLLFSIGNTTHNFSNKWFLQTENFLREACVGGVDPSSMGSKKRSRAKRRIQSRSRTAKIVVKPAKPAKPVSPKRITPPTVEVLNKLGGLLPEQQVPFELPTEVVDESWQLKVGLAEFEVTHGFSMPQDWIAPLVARERPPKYHKLAHNIYSDPGLKGLRVRKSSVEIEKCTCKEIDDKNRKLKQLEAKGISAPLPAPASTRKRSAPAVSEPEPEVEIKIQGCGDDCLNRAVQIECSDLTCSYEDESLCKNRRLTKREYLEVTPVRTDLKGWGLRLDVAVEAGQFIHEYIGDVISSETCSNRLKQQYTAAKKSRMTHDQVHHYFLNMGDNMVIDAESRGGVCRFLNHSCNPNCEIQVWKVNNEPRAGLFALRNIPEGSELTIDYRYDGLDENIVKTQPCFCGEPNCAKVIGGERRALESKKAKKKRKMSKQAAKKMREFTQGLASDSFCSICGEVGELIMCDGTVDGRDCPRCFHPACLKRKGIPTGKWICPYHFCDDCGKAPAVFCRTCSDSWCNACAEKLRDKLKPSPESPEDSGKVEFVMCPECVLRPLNPVRDPETITRVLAEVEKQQTLAERILKGQKVQETVQLDLEGLAFYNPQIPAKHLHLAVAAVYGKKALTDALCRQLADHTKVPPTKIQKWFAANQVLLENPLNFFSELLLPKVPTGGNDSDSSSDENSERGAPAAPSSPSSS